MSIITQIAEKLESVREFAEHYHQLGWTVIPLCKPTEDGCSAGKLHHKRDKNTGAIKPCNTPGKRPLENSWQNKTTDDFSPEQFGDGTNIGVLLGEASGWLVDVEFDRQEAVAAADVLLPKTGAVFGREGSPRSHRLYLCPGAETVAYDMPVSVAATGRRRIVEIRADGHQSVLPPSLHYSGQTVRWYEQGAPATCKWQELRRAVRRVAAAVVLANVWRQGIRNDASMAIAGWLLRAGWKLVDVERFLQAVYAAGNDEEADDHIKTIRRTKDKLASDKRATGFPRLVELVGEDVASFVADMLTVERENGNDAKPKRLVVKWTGSDADMKELLWQKLQETNDPPRLFKRSGHVVRLTYDENGFRLQDMDAAILRYEIERRLKLIRRKYDPHEDRVREVEVGITDSFARQMLATPYNDIPLPILKRVVNAPTFAADGELLDKNGFYPEHGILVDIPTHLRIPPVPERVSKTHVDEAKRWILHELLVDFPFMADADRANAVALLLLPFIREMIPGPTPLHVIQAPAQGTGKTLLANVLLGVAGGKQFTLSYPENDETEMRKLLLSSLKDSPTSILFDNVKCTVKSASLQNATTNLEYAGRELGVAENVQFPVRCAWVLTSNNAELDKDSARRSVFITIDARMEHPHLRTGFKHPQLLLWLSQNRAQLIWSALVLVKWWIQNGKKKSSHSIGSYETYAPIMGGLLECCGIHGFLENKLEMEQRADYESSAWGKFVRLWWENFKEEKVTIKQLLPLTEHIYGLNISGNDDRARSASLGKQLRQRDGSIISGFIIQEWGRADSKTKASQYRLVRSGTSEGSELSEVFPTRHEIEMCFQNECENLPNLPNLPTTEQQHPEEDPFAGVDRLLKVARAVELLQNTELSDQARSILLSNLTEEHKAVLSAIVLFIQQNLERNGQRTEHTELLTAYRRWAEERGVQVDDDAFLLALWLWAGPPDADGAFPVHERHSQTNELFPELEPGWVIDAKSALATCIRWMRGNTQTTSTAGRFSRRDGDVIHISKNHQF